MDNLEHASAQKGLLRVRLTGLSGETEHVDALSLLVADHALGSSVAPDGSGRLWALGRLEAPQAARDFRNRDMLRQVSGKDDWGWESALRIRDASLDEELRDGLEIAFRRPAGARSARLVIDGCNTPWAMHLMREVVAMHGTETQAWYDAVATDPARAQRIRQTMARETFLHVKVWTGKAWEHQGSVPDIGPECTKRQVVCLDLTRVEGATVRVRLECVPNLWLVDCTSIDFSPEQPVSSVELEPEAARDIKGEDVRLRLATSDNVEYVIAPGDTAEVSSAFLR